MKKITMTAKNKAFWAKPKAEQRVAVAKDVIKQLQSKFLNASSGVYLEVANLDETILEPSEKLDEVFSSLKKGDAMCNVCGIGGCFVSLVNLGNSAPTEKYMGKKVYDGIGVDSIDMRELLRKVFPPEQLTLIECAFEESNSFKDSEDDSTPFERRLAAMRFGQKYATDKNRLIWIMRNIIKNKGEFKP